MWDEPYLETCCRAALHRLWLAGEVGRPVEVPDGACLRRLATMGLCERAAGGRYVLNRAGALRHRVEVLKAAPRPEATTAGR